MCWGHVLSVYQRSRIFRTTKAALKRPPVDHVTHRLKSFPNDSTPFQSSKAGFSFR